MTASRLLALFSLAFGSAFAAPPGTFSVHDTDADGFLSRAEYSALLDQCHAHRDARGRGRCDPNRLLPFDMLDDDHDGRISEAELIDAMGRRHRRGAGWRQ
jgi:hypothetical protein